FRKDINVHRSERADQNQSPVSLVKAKESVGSLARAITRDKNSDLDSYAMHEQKHPPALTSTPSFWNKLGRRMSQKRHSSSTFAGPSSTTDVQQRTRAASGTESMSLAAIAETPVEKQADVCAHCGNDKFIDFAVAPTANATANQPVNISKAIHKATRKDAVHPKQKHVDTLIQMTLSGASMEELFMLVQDRFSEANWVISFKALILVHILMHEGNGPAIYDYLIRRPNALDMHRFRDRHGTKGVSEFEQSKN
ncbi:hypothetical protein GGF47_005433, partial [Coemansia sp. RSA 2524]